METEPLSLVGPTEKCRGPGSSPLMLPPRRRREGGGAARAAHAQRGLERPDSPAAGSAQEPAGTSESAGTGCPGR